MSYESVRESIAQYLVDSWGENQIVAAGKTYARMVENRAFTPTPGNVWLRWGLRPASQISADITGTMKRTRGLIWFQIFVPEDGGERVANEIGDEISNKFFEKYVGSIKCDSAVLAFIGPDGSGWMRWSVTVAYRDDSA